MYTSKQFSVRPWQDIESEIKAAALSFPLTEKVFLADGDALVLANSRLLPILELLHEQFPRLKRVTSYALPQNLLNKSVDEMKELKAAGLNMLYFGVESGDPTVLQKIKKGATHEEMIEAMGKAHEAGLIISTTNLLGVGGKKYSAQHAAQTAALLSAANPKYISFLTVMFPLGSERFHSAFGDDYEPLEQAELFDELYRIIDALEVHDVEFRSNHASNYLALKGTLPQDKPQLLATIRQAIAEPNSPFIRSESMRGL